MSVSVYSPVAVVSLFTWYIMWIILQCNQIVVAYLNNLFVNFLANLLACSMALSMSISSSESLTLPPYIKTLHDGG